MERRPPVEPSPLTSRPDRSEWAVVRTLLPYLWTFRWRVLLALGFMIAAKFGNVGVPLVLKRIVDALSIKPGEPAAVLVLPVALLVAYGALRLTTSTFTELRELVFAKVTQRAVRNIALQVFGHLHALSLRFHLERQTGGMTRDIERGSRGVSSLVSMSLYTILPTLVELGLVLTILATRYDKWFTIITAIALVVYITFTITVTEWRTHFRRTMNELDSKANIRAIDSLLNYETVKYFSNEAFETRRYDESMQRWEKAAVKSQTSLSMLNVGQSALIAIAVSLIIWRATVGVIAGTMSLGDLVLVNAFMIQLYIPLNFLGVIYREIKQSVADVDRMFTLLDQEREVADDAGAQPLALGDPTVRFEHVDFGYDDRRQILHDIDFTIGAGQTVAVVGAERLGQVDARATDVPLLRRDRRRHHDRRPGHPPRHAVVAARSYRHRSPGHGAVQRHDRLQHRLWPGRRHRRRHAGAGRVGGQGPPTSTTSCRACPTATPPRSASAASSCRAARSSASRSPARC